MQWLKRALTLLLMLTLALPLCGAGAEGDGSAEAEDITRQCSFKLCDNYFKYTMMCDGKYTTHWRTKNKVKHGWIRVTAPKDKPICGVYICFAQIPDEWELQALRGKDWEPVYTRQNDYAHVYIPLENGEEQLRLYISSDKRQQLDLNEITFFAEGEKPDWVQVWQPTREKADILFLSAHPDDELIFFCGGIPTYNTERGCSVVVAYLCYSNTTRRSELLNGLWYLGVRNYPVIGDFSDTGFPRNNRSKQTAEYGYQRMGGEAKVKQWAVALMRQYRPEVVVSHDINGEYGHPMHKVAADAAIYACTQAAEETVDAASLQQWGAWQVKKLYLHLWPENQIHLDWSQPLASLGGLSGLQAAGEAYVRFHKTQETSGMSVDKTGSEYDNTLYGLYLTTVGPDVDGGDYLEHISTAAQGAAE